MTDKPAEPSGFDPTELLSKLERIVNNNKAPEGGGKSWISTLVIIAVVLAGIAIWSWVSYRQGRELAKLRHEREKQRILADKAAVDARVAENQAEIARLELEVDRLDDKVEVIEADIRAEEQRHAADKRAIDRIRSWRDVEPGWGG